MNYDITKREAEKITLALNRINFCVPNIFEYTAYLY